MRKTTSPDLESPVGNNATIRLQRVLRRFLSLSIIPSQDGQIKSVVPLDLTSSAKVATPRGGTSSTQASRRRDSRP